MSVFISLNLHQKRHNIFQCRLRFSPCRVVSGGCSRGGVDPVPTIQSCLSHVVWLWSRVRLHITTPQQKIPGEEHGKDQPHHDTLQSTACCQHMHSHGQSILRPSVHEASVSEQKTAANRSKVPRRRGHGDGEHKSNTLATPCKQQAGFTEARSSCSTGPETYTVRVTAFLA